MRLLAAVLRRSVSFLYFVSALPSSIAHIIKKFSGADVVTMQVSTTPSGRDLVALIVT